SLEAAVYRATMRLSTCDNVTGLDADDRRRYLRPARRCSVVLFYWAAIGIVLGAIAHLFLRIRGEEGYQVVGEALLGCVGGMTTGMVLGVIFGWRHVDLESGLAAALGAVVTLSLVVYFTLAASPGRAHREAEPASERP